MQNITAPLWDAEFLAYRLRAGLEWKKKAQFEQDWKLAEMEAIRQVANTVEYHALCRSARCRRARRCVGNTAPCKRLPESELKPAEMQRRSNRPRIKVRLHGHFFADAAR